MDWRSCSDCSLRFGPWSCVPIRIHILIHSTFSFLPVFCLISSHSSLASINPNRQWVWHFDRQTLRERFQGRGISGCVERRDAQNPYAARTILSQMPGDGQGRDWPRNWRPQLHLCVGRAYTPLPVARRIDNVNFASRTIWEDATKKGDSFRFFSRRARAEIHGKGPT